MPNFSSVCSLLGITPAFRTLQLSHSAHRARHVPLVSHGFNEASRDPRAWPELSVTRLRFLQQNFFQQQAHINPGSGLLFEDRWRRFLRWLAVRASGLQALELGDGHVVSTLIFVCLYMSSVVKRSTHLPTTPEGLTFKLGVSPAVAINLC